MADKKISELTNITGANLADADEFVVVDTSASETKAITYGELKKFTGTVTADGLTVDGAVGINVVNSSGFAEYIQTSAALPDRVVRWARQDGTINPRLDVYAEDGGIRLDGNAALGSARTLTISTDDKDRALFASNGDISFYEDTGTTPKFFWDASAESLGIGTSSPAELIHIAGGAAAAYLKATNSAGTQGIEVGVTAAGDGIVNVQDAKALRLFTTDTERMRIDASGNLLVGMSTASATADGFYFDQSGFMAVSRSRPTANTSLVAQFNRKTTDGDIVQFHKDGATVGSIGVDASDDIFINGANDHIRFHTNGSEVLNVNSSGSFYPASGATSADLGISGRNFKDLYLSGGVYLGGTGAANLLDDYEEGTWTATIGCTGNATTTTTKTGYYTKVGRKVTVSFRNMDDIDTTGLSGFLSVSIPFACVTGDVGFVGGVSFDNLVYPASVVELKPVVNNGASAALISLTGDNVALTLLSATVLTSGTTDIAYFTLTYFTA